MSSELSKAKEILEVAGILDEVERKETILIPITKVLVNSKTFDNNTIIYRLAMMIYHAKRNAGAQIIESIEDPGFIYLKLMQDQKIKKLFEELLIERPFLSAIDLTKTLICFIIGAYLFYKAVS